MSAATMLPAGQRPRTIRHRSRVRISTLPRWVGPTLTLMASVNVLLVLLLLSQ